MSDKARRLTTLIFVGIYAAIVVFFYDDMTIRYTALAILGGVIICISIIYSLTNMPLTPKALAMEVFSDVAVAVLIYFVVSKLN